MELATVILAAGQGTRMKSDTSKVLHPLGERPLVMHALETARAVSDVPPTLVVGRDADDVREAVGDDALFVEQSEQRGTGHAVLQARSALRGRVDLVAVTYADMPLLRVETLRRLRQTQEANPGPMTILVLRHDDPRGFGRVIRDETGAVSRVVEEAVASSEEMAIRELNAGVYCFDAAWLWKHIDQVPLSLPKREYYLPDLVGLAVEQGLRVDAVVTEDAGETVGINTRVHLAEAAAVLQRRINEHWMLAGVTILDPATTYIGPGVTIGQDTTIWPNTHIRGRTGIGCHCEIGPNSVIEASHIADRCRVFASVLTEAVMEVDSDIGPFGRLRSGAHLGPGVHMGNFGEVKNAHLGPGVHMGHFSYVGDADVGAHVNIGAGTITCNFDGERKNRTEIGDDAFIGSDTLLVAPVRIGRAAWTGSGAVVTHDVPDEALAYGVPARVHGSRAAADEAEGEELANGEDDGA